MKRREMNAKMRRLSNEQDRNSTILDVLSLER